MFLTCELIRSYSPCYDPNKFLVEDRKYSLVDFLKINEIPAKDRIWVVVRKEVLTQNQLKHFGLASARLAEKFSKDPRVKECNDATEAYLKGDLSLEELKKFRNAAYAAAAYAADAYAAYAYAAYAAADAAAADADADAAADAAAAAAYAAAAAADAAADAARAEMREEQVSALIKILSGKTL